MIDFDHFIITRFNVRTAEHQSQASEEWLRHRMELFRTYCAPSVLRQTVTNFSWLLMLDAGTPRWLRKELEQLRDRAAVRIELVYHDCYFSSKTLRHVLLERQSSRLVVSTRLDNDDLIATDFVQTIHENLRDERFLLLNFTNGSQLSDGIVFRRPYPANPFITLIERGAASDHHTIFATDHYHMPEIGPVRNIRSPHPLWMQVIHGANLENEVIGLPMLPASLRAWFPAADFRQPEVVQFMYLTIRQAFRILARLVSKPRRLLALLEVATAKRPVSRL